MDRPSFGIGDEFLRKGIDDPNVNAYYRFMVDAAVLFGANPKNAEAELLHALNFEINLAKVFLSLKFFIHKYLL